jgi:hypothetical protein
MTVAYGRSASASNMALNAARVVMVCGPTFASLDLSAG